MQKVIEQVTGKTVRTITLVMVGHQDKDMSPQMTKDTSSQVVVRLYLRQPTTKCTVLAALQEPVRLLTTKN